MPSNYQAICEENQKSYGTKGAQKSGELAASLYDDRTHFIFELLQNAEDALGRRTNWEGSRKVKFALYPNRLKVSHFGKPFDEADVRSICDIAESTKNESSIGRFGLGFKSVYSITDLPAIHSGDEDFAIENYVFPRGTKRSDREVDETQIILPLRYDDLTAAQDITEGFRRLGSGSLLFLNHIEEIEWSVEGGLSGVYLRNQPKILGSNVRQITVIGEEDGKNEVDENWLVFHRDVFSATNQKVGRVEIAFSLVAVNLDCWAVQPLPMSPLVVFFPTVVESHLGFLVQGPYRTTPSRDNIPPGDPWNKHLVLETSALLVEALRWMRDKSMLGVDALKCLPLDPKKFSENSRFAPMFLAVRQAFQDEALLPTFDEGHVLAREAKLARTEEVRELFSPEQVTALFGSKVAAWLSADITQVKTREIRDYLIYQLGIEEIRPEKLVPSLTKEFLEAQSDEWVVRLYEFLSGQEKTLRRHLDTVPLIRLENGTHVVSRSDEKPNAFLPGAVTTSFPTMRPSVCPTPEVRLFLISLGITEPDPVDDVMWNLLPKYHMEELAVGDEDYSADIERILAAFKTDSTAKKEKLGLALRATTFVKVIDTGDGNRHFAKPGDVYIATERLQQLFAGVPHIRLVDSQYDCLRGERIRELLESCGALRYPRPLAAPNVLTSDEKLELRRKTGYEHTSGAKDHVTDWLLQGFEDLIKLLPDLSAEQRIERSRLIWESLGDLEERRGSGIFEGSYTWSHYGERKTPPFPAAFVRMLNQVAWVSNVDGELVPPELVEYDTLGWKPNPFLLTKIAFKPPIIDQLAKEAGIDPAILDLLRRDPALVAELTSRLSAKPTAEPPAPEPAVDVYASARDLYGDDMPDIPGGTPEPDGASGGQVGTAAAYTDSQNKGGQGNFGAQGRSRGEVQGKRTPGNTTRRTFISYVAIHPDEGDPDPDGLDHAALMRIEASAIDLVVSLEPALLRTEVGNSGFDLFAVDDTGKPIRWVEVKSMTGTLSERPVGLSRAQFDFAREKGDAYSLYVVERATDQTRARVLKIHNPVGRAQTFTFDHGWCEIAETDSQL